MFFESIFWAIDSVISVISLAKINLILSGMNISPEEFPPAACSTIEKQY